MCLHKAKQLEAKLHPLWPPPPLEAIQRHLAVGLQNLASGWKDQMLSLANMTEQGRENRQLHKALDLPRHITFSLARPERSDQIAHNKTPWPLPHDFRKTCREPFPIIKVPSLRSHRPHPVAQPREAQ